MKLLHVQKKTILPLLKTCDSVDPVIQLRSSILQMQFLLVMPLDS